MKSIGMRYCEQNKNYYVDGHEQKYVVLVHWTFSRIYLRMELQIHYWIQLKKEEVINMEMGIEISTESRFRIVNDQDDGMYEFHVDTQRRFQGKYDRNTMYGDQSVRKPPGYKIVLPMVNGDAIYNKNEFSEKLWSGPSG